MTHSRNTFYTMMCYVYTHMLGCVHRHTHTHIQPKHMFHEAVLTFSMCGLFDIFCSSLSDPIYFFKRWSWLTKLTSHLWKMGRKPWVRGSRETWVIGWKEGGQGALLFLSWMTRGPVPLQADVLATRARLHFWPHEIFRYAQLCSLLSPLWMEWSFS